VLLDGIGGNNSRYAYIAVDPFDTVRVAAAAEHADPFAALRARLAKYRMAHDAATLPAPFIGGAVGFVGYEVAHALERLPPRKVPAFPLDLAFGFYDAVAVFDLSLKKAWVVSSGLPEMTEALRIKRAAARAEALEQQLGTEPLPEIAAAPGGAWTAELSESAYKAKAEAIIAYIRAGDIFQANLTQRWTAPWPRTISPFALYRRLLNLSAAPFAAYLSLDADTHIISASPERFLSVDHRGAVETRPIKGTRPRGATPETDRALAAELRASPKDRAENLMIVDLLRNDLSRVCRAGSVEVPTLCGLESFAHVHHLVSVVTGQLRPECSAVDLLAACFPGGSITGAPKIRAMEIIHELEPSARGPYCGTVAWLGFDGAMDSSIVIRTLIRSGDQLCAQAGGGIVADSDPAAEYAESVLKAQPLLAALTGHDRFTCASA
jgi:para-aminobenzoate synthetase component I